MRVRNFDLSLFKNFAAEAGDQGAVPHRGAQCVQHRPVLRPQYQRDLDLLRRDHRSGERAAAAAVRAQAVVVRQAIAVCRSCRVGADSGGAVCGFDRRGGATTPAAAERPADHGGRPEQRHGHLRPPPGEDAEPRSAGRAGRAVRPRLHPVSAVQSEPRLADDRPAARHDPGPRSADRFPHGPARRGHAAADVPAQRLRRGPRRQDLSLRQSRPDRHQRSGRSGVVGRGRQPARHRQGRGAAAHEPTRRRAASAARSRYYASPAPDEAAHRRQSRGRDDRAARETQGPSVLHRRRLLPAALPVHRAAEVLRPVSARPDSGAAGFADGVWPGCRPPALVHEPAELGRRASRGSGRPSAPTTPRSASSTPRSAGCSTRSIACGWPTTPSSSSSATTATTSASAGSG